MKLIEKLKRIIKNKKFIAWFVLVVIGSSIFVYDLKNHKNFTIDNTLPDTLVVDSKYNVKKINPLEFKRSFNPHISGDNVLYEVNDDPLHSESTFVLYNTITQKTKMTKLDSSYRDINLSGNYAVLSKLEDPHSDTYFIYLYDVKKDTIIKIGDTRTSSEVLISDNYVYWMGNKQEEILKRYNINTKQISNFNVPYRWNDINGNKIVYLEGLEHEGWFTSGDLNRLVVLNIDSKEKINLPEDKFMKTYIRLSDQYVTWINDPWNGNPQIKYYSIASGEVKNVSMSPKINIFDLNIDGGVLVYLSKDNTSNENCLYTYDILKEKENKILCDVNINGISDSINVNKNIIFDISREDDFENQLSDVFLIKL